MQSNNVRTLGLISVLVFGFQSLAVADTTWPEGVTELDRIVAFVGDEIVTLHELDLAVGANRVLGAPMDEDTIELRKKALDALIDEKLILAEAKSLDLEVSDEEVNAHLNKTKRQNGWSDAQLAENVARLGMSLEQYRALTAKELLKGRTSAYRISSRVNVSETDIQRELDAHYEGGKVQDELRISILLRRVSDDATEEDASESLRFAHWVHQQVTAAPEHFDDLARKYSEHNSSRLDGGDLGYFTRGMLADPIIEQAAFSLDDGGVSELLDSSMGMLIVHVAERRKAPVTDLESLKARVYERLYTAARITAHRDWTRELRDKSYVKVLL